jgi:hypothetical protein
MNNNDVLAQAFGKIVSKHRLQNMQQNTEELNAVANTVIGAEPTLIRINDTQESILQAKLNHTTHLYELKIALLEKNIQKQNAKIEALVQELTLAIDRIKKINS